MAARREGEADADGGEGRDGRRHDGRQRRRRGRRAEVHDAATAGAGAAAAPPAAARDCAPPPRRRRRRRSQQDLHRPARTPYHPLPGASGLPREGGLASAVLLARLLKCSECDLVCK